MEGGEVKVGTERFCFIDHQVLRSFKEEVLNNVKNGKFIIYEGCKKGGVKLGKAMYLAYHLNNPIDLIKLMSEGSMELAGWGKFSVKDLDHNNRRCIFEVQSSPVALDIKGHTCDDIRGQIAGVCEFAWKEKIDCVETSCIGNGDKFCTFVVKKNKEFDKSSKIVKQQIRV